MRRTIRLLLSVGALVLGLAPNIQAEDCVEINYRTAEVKQIGTWKIVDGSHWAFDFGNNPNSRQEAEKALHILRANRVTESCFVGRPNPHFSYVLSAGHTAPSAVLHGEDCISFEPSKISLAQIGGRWKIVEGNMWMLDFEQNAVNARLAYDIIKKYQFNQQCFVGRPNPPFSYWKRVHPIHHPRLG